MPFLFIDANIYLNFYKETANHFRGLLLTLKNMRADIFVTDQIVHEVMRNKLIKFLADAPNLKPDSSGYNGKAPVSFEEDAVAEKAFRKRQENINKEIKSLDADFRENIRKIAMDIAVSEDRVSKELDVIFSGCVTPSDDEIKKARWRKEIGNPPGKKSDATGDQISWEQLLSFAKKDDSVWIVTKDSDYFIQFDKGLRLNPLLYKELKDKLGARGGIYVFNELLSAIKDFKEKTGKDVKDLPSEKIQKKIEEEAPYLLWPPEAISFGSNADVYYPSSTSAPGILGSGALGNVFVYGSSVNPRDLVMNYLPSSLDHSSLSGSFSPNALNVSTSGSYNSILFSGAPLSGEGNWPFVAMGPDGPTRTVTYLSDSSKAPTEATEPDTSGGTEMSALRFRYEPEPKPKK